MSEGTGVINTKSICFFASYFKGDTIPYYIQVYLLELKKHFSQLVLLASNEKISKVDLKFLEDNNIVLQQEKNEGFDFGLWFKAMQKYDISNFDTVALINDSSVLFRSLDNFVKWAKHEKADLLGMTESYAVSHHIQSYFLWIKKPALIHVKNYFEQNGIIKLLDDVIRVYEIGLSSELINKGFTLSSFVSNNGYKGEFAPYYYCVDSHLKQGIPLIKKKIIYNAYRKDELFSLARMNFNINADYYINLIKQINTDSLIDFEKVKLDQVSQMTAFDKFVYNFKRVMILNFRKLKGKV